MASFSVSALWFLKKTVIIFFNSLAGLSLRPDPQLPLRTVAMKAETQR
jgi:hypothetical protein